MASWGTKRGDLHSQDDLSPWVQWTVRVSNALAGCPYSKDCVTSENKHDWLVVSQKSGNISNCGGAGGQGVNLTSEYHSLNNGFPPPPPPRQVVGHKTPITQSSHSKSHLNWLWLLCPLPATCITVKWFAEVHTSAEVGEKYGQPEKRHKMQTVTKRTFDARRRKKIKNTNNYNNERKERIKLKQTWSRSLATQSQDSSRQTIKGYEKTRI